MGCAIHVPNEMRNQLNPLLGRRLGQFCSPGLLSRTAVLHCGFEIPYPGGLEIAALRTVRCKTFRNELPNAERLTKHLEGVATRLKHHRGRSRGLAWRDRMHPGGAPTHRSAAGRAPVRRSAGQSPVRRRAEGAAAGRQSRRLVQPDTRTICRRLAAKFGNQEPILSSPTPQSLPASR